MFEIPEKADKIAIFAHIRPDGDTLGGVLALGLSLKLAGRDVDMFCDSEIPEFYMILDGIKLINSEPYSEYDMLIAVDCADPPRLGVYARRFLAHPNTLNIDHHYTNTKYAKTNAVVPSASCCEIIYSGLKDNGLPINKNIAECIYCGIVTDTGNFAQSNTTKNSFAVTAELLDYGIDVEFLSDAFLNQKPYARHLLVAKSIQNMRFFCNGKICIVTIRLADLNEFGLNIQDTEGIIRYAIGCTGVLAGICLTESTPNTYKVSLRSKRSVDISAAAERFGGGGHKQAAGCVVSGALEEVIEKLVRAAELELPLN